jgi:hypothetical protein
MEMKQILYAFWKYDICPYMLGGEVEQFRPDGSVAVKGYDGFALKPLTILPEDSGKEALDTLKMLITEYQERERELKDDYRRRAHEIVGLSPGRP